MDQLVTLQIDGREVKVPKGTLLVEAAKTVGITIPVFCYHEKMKPVGACRMCLVEIEKMPKLQTACTTPVAEGMIVHTTSPKVVDAQRSVIEFLLINHPLDCPVCDKGGECPLQDNTFRWGLGVSRYEDVKRHFVKPIDLSPEVKLDRERCIMCLRCVRFTREIAGDESLVIVSRGSYSEIATAPGRTFDSPFSGNTIEICPVGALTSAQFRFRARIWDLRKIPSICDKCPVGCNLELQVRPNRDKLLRLWSRENTPVDDGWLCDRGRFDYQYVDSPDRLQQPLVRRNGQLSPATWTEALDAIREGFQGILGEHGGRVLGALGSSRGTNEEGYLLQKLFRAVLGTNNVDHTWQPHPATARLPFDAATGSIAGLERAGVILVVGADPIAEQPVLDLRIKKAAGKGAKIMVVGPDEIDLARYGRWIKVPAAAMADVVDLMSLAILEEGLQDDEFVRLRTSGVDDLRDALSSRSLDDAAFAAGSSPDAIREMARDLAGAKGGCILFRRDLLGAGEVASDRLIAAIQNLALLTGSLGRDGVGIYPLFREANAQGCVDVGLTPHHLPGHRPLVDADARAALESLWGTRLPVASGQSGAEMVRGGARALYLIGHDPVGQSGDSIIRAALERLELLVVQDVFLTETARLARVVLPGVTFAERDGTYTNLERRVQRLRPGVKPPGEARPDWQIVRDVANALGGGFDYATPQEVMAELTVAAPIYRGITYARVGDKGLQWPRRLTGRKGTTSLYAEVSEAEERWRFVVSERADVLEK